MAIEGPDQRAAHGDRVVQGLGEVVARVPAHQLGRRDALKLVDGDLCFNRRAV
jgi:hypothetical protein